MQIVMMSLDRLGEAEKEVLQLRESMTAVGT
jgi:hypothetical protein